MVNPVQKVKKASLQKCASQEERNTEVHRTEWAEVTDVMFIGAIEPETAQHASLQKEAAVNSDRY